MRRACAVALALALPAAAGAHEVLYRVERGKALAFEAYFASGEVLAYAAYEVYSPADEQVPYQTGRTDRGGALAFVPDRPGKWRVKVVGQGGHGIDVAVDVGAVQASAARASGLALTLRPLVGIGAIAAVFAALVVFYRRRDPQPRT